jgi:hypothetical protein
MVRLTIPHGALTEILEVARTESEGGRVAESWAYGPERRLRHEVKKIVDPSRRQASGDRLYFDLVLGSS